MAPISQFDYDPINWEDYPATSTPLSSANLNKMDQAIYQLAAILNEMTTHINEIEGLNESIEGDMKSYTRQAIAETLNQLASS